MKKFKPVLLTISLVLIALISNARDSVQSVNLPYNPEEHKIIPDKFFEFGIPLLIIFILLNTIVTVLKNRADHQLKLKMVEKGISEDTLIKVFRESKMLEKLQPLKWFLFSLALASSFITIYLLRDSFGIGSGYLPVGIILLFFSIASFIYYKIISKPN